MRVISWISYIFFTILETFIRFFPIPAKTGLVKIGDPDRNSPVFVTCNFHLTILRVKRALQNINCYLLIANSKGINVWCAAAGGHFSHHEIISILKVSGINELVDHRKIILPQLGATGIEPIIIREKTGWQGIWGPVYAKDIPEFLESEFLKKDWMREVNFSFFERIEIAVAWAFPISVLFLIPLLIFWTNESFILIILVWGTSLLLDLLFPFYEKFLRESDKAKNKIRSIMPKIVLFFVFWSINYIPLIFYYIYSSTVIWSFLLRWGIISALVVAIFIFDLKGGTPVYKSDMIEDQIMKINIDKGRCKGVEACIKVCPRGCYELNEDTNIIKMKYPDKCIQCGACVVQCPFDALSFKTKTNKIISPDVIRRYKLNLSGKRI